MAPPVVDLPLQLAIQKIKGICDQSGGRSQYFPYGGSGYKASVTHYFESSTEVAGGAVQPGSEEDLQKIMEVINETRVRFAVKCGGHSTNPGFSSTDGIQIYLLRLNKINVFKNSESEWRVRVGAGCLFEELYQELDPHGINIVGGSGLAGVGVSGWMLGGGYSVKTSQHGLGIDNIAGVRVVLPDGKIATANKDENSDLFFAIKGGVNNFGIITEFELVTHAQGELHDFSLNFKNPELFGHVKAAMYRLIEKKDNKANIEAVFRYSSKSGATEPEVVLTVHCVYDGTYPSGEDPFEELENLATLDNMQKLQINAAHNGVQENRVKSQSYARASAVPIRHQTCSYLAADLRRSFANGTYDITSQLPTEHLAHISSLDMPGFERPNPPMAGIGQFPRGRWGNVMVDQFTPAIIDEIEKQAKEASSEMIKHGGTRVGVDLWPFTPAMFDKATHSAWPHEQGHPNCPIIISFTWEGANNDEYWIETMEKTIATLRAKVIEERPLSKDLPYFINTAFAQATTIENIYGKNLDELKKLRVKYDPNNIMQLAGGFRIPRE